LLSDKKVAQNPKSCRKVAEQNLDRPTVDNKKIKISQYADDTTHTLDGSREALASALNLLDDCSKVSGLRLNNEKTETL